MTGNHPSDAHLSAADRLTAGMVDAVKRLEPNFVVVPLGDMAAPGILYDLLFAPGELTVLHRRNGGLERSFGRVERAFDDGIALSTGLGEDTIAWSDVHLIEPGALYDVRRNTQGA